VDYTKTFGETLRVKREAKGLLLRQVAAMLDMDTAILSKIERSQRNISKEQVFKLADILGIEREELLIHYLSEKIAIELMGERLADKTLKIAEKKIKHMLKAKS
jgi:HTH-type transcriptional regulator, competence development regulator